MTEDPFFFRDGERVIRFGAGVAERTEQLLGENGFGGPWVLLTTERARGQLPDGLADAAAEALDVAAGPVPDAAAGLLDGVAGRDLVAFGGGRVVDVAKAAVAAGGGKTAAVPTTLAGSTFTPFHRMPAGHEGYGSVRPALAVCDPALMTSAPRDTLAATAMNALAHGVEALYGPLANPVAEGASLRGAPLIVQALEADPEGSEELALGALLCGYAVGVAAGMVVHHACCQTIVRVLGTPHAPTNAVMLPRSIAFMADRAPAPLGRLAAALGERDVPAVAERVARVGAAAGPTTLAELGVGEDDLDAVLDAVMQHPGIAATPGGVDRADVRALLDSAGPG
ncbi:MAG TPA: iron-containing alcohol dehydrogenase [Thermoleophilaceae bacterium]|nr:iron-containing alcohol dehydrogenase [Thermoleophilaceae bacterium]